MKFYSRQYFSSIVHCAILGCVLYGCKLNSPPAQSKILADALPDSTRIPETWIADTDTGISLNNWLSLLNDSSLNRIVEESVLNNLDLRKAASLVEIEQQRFIVVSSRLKPQIGGDAGYSSMLDDQNSGAYSGTKAIGLAAWEPDVWGKLRSEQAAAASGYEAGQLDFLFAKQSLAATTAKSWYLTIETRLALSVARQTVANYNDMLAIVKLKRDLGRVGDLDVEEAKANLHAAQSMEIQAEGYEKETRRNLEELLGRYPSAELKTAEDFAVQPPPVSPGIPSSLLTRRPDMLAAEKKVIAAFRKEEAARLALYPSFSLNVVGGRLADNLLLLLQLNPWMIAASIGLTVPVYTAGRLPAQIKIATDEQQIAVTNYGIVALRAFREVENCLMYQVLLTQRYAIEKNVLDDRTSSLRIARLKYDAGSIDLLSVLQLQQAQTASQLNLIKLRFEQLTNFINLQLNLGSTYN